MANTAFIIGLKLEMQFMQVNEVKIIISGKFSLCLAGVTYAMHCVVPLQEWF